MLCICDGSHLCATCTTAGRDLSDIVDFKTALLDAVLFGSEIMCSEPGGEWRQAYLTKIFMKVGLCGSIFIIKEKRQSGYMLMVYCLWVKRAASNIFKKYRRH